MFIDKDFSGWILALFIYSVLFKIVCLFLDEFLYVFYKIICKNDFCKQTLAQTGTGPLNFRYMSESFVK